MKKFLLINRTDPKYLIILKLVYLIPLLPFVFAFGMLWCDISETRHLWNHLSYEIQQITKILLK